MVNSNWLILRDDTIYLPQKIKSILVRPTKSYVGSNSICNIVAQMHYDELITIVN